MCVCVCLCVRVIVYEYGCYMHSAIRPKALHVFGVGLILTAISIQC